VTSALVPREREVTGRGVRDKPTNRCQLPSTVEISFKRVQRWVSRVRRNFLAGNLRRMDELHLDFPFAGSRTLRDLLNAGVETGRRHVATLMRRKGIEALL
jgi:hypothetical protein